VACHANASMILCEFYSHSDSLTRSLIASPGVTQ
jgi:hypothetical protein